MAGGYMIGGCRAACVTPDGKIIMSGGQGFWWSPFYNSVYELDTPSPPAPKSSVSVSIGGRASKIGRMSTNTEMVCGRH